jgi:hypothetical protein
MWYDTVFVVSVFFLKERQEHFSNNITTADNGRFLGNLLINKLKNPYF